MPPFGVLIFEFVTDDNKILGRKDSAGAGGIMTEVYDVHTIYYTS